MNLHKIIISNDKFAIYIAIFSLCLSLFASSAAIKNTINQKEIDSLSAFSAVYLEQQQLLMRLRCIEKKFPHLLQNPSAVWSIESLLQENLDLVLKERGDGFGYEVQKAAIIMGMQTIPTARTQLHEIALIAEPSEYEIIKYCFEISK